MNLLNRFWIAVQRNPVINAFVLAVLVQFLQDYRADAIDWAHIAGYLSALCLGVAARMFTVPAKEVPKSDSSD